jgi:hypothetical protein
LAHVFEKSWESFDMDLIYDVCHNIAKLEEHIVVGQLKKLWVHRKGATRAFPPGHPEISAKVVDICASHGYIEWQTHSCRVRNNLIRGYDSPALPFSRARAVFFAVRNRNRAFDERHPMNAWDLTILSVCWLFGGGILAFTHHLARKECPHVGVIQHPSDGTTAHRRVCD